MLVFICCMLFANFLAVRLMLNYGVDTYFYDKLQVAYSIGGPEGLKAELAKIPVTDPLRREAVLAKDFSFRLKTMGDPEAFLKEKVYESKKKAYFIRDMRSAAIFLMLILFVCQMVLGFTGKPGAIKGGRLLLFFPLLLCIAGCACMEKESGAPVKVSEAALLGSMQNPIVDSDSTLEEALRKYAPFEFKRRQRLVEVLYYSFDGKIHKGQLVIDERLVGDIREVFRVALEDKFPIQSVIPISNSKFYKDGEWNGDDQSMLANNTSAFNYRKVTGGKKLSKHSYGFAIDINPVQNPYIKKDIVLPPGAVYDPFVPGTLTSDCALVLAFTRLGWTWGGRWSSLKDYQHFEKVAGDLREYEQSADAE
ncbi:MAG: M15 family metallopeptidase [Candidatus Omnitrophica bacterium]|nr:M15 family metallopeptidase [Candidatus Omnitrophota bacterium]MDD5042409.1 M15 family metallopeptidase [Candidatus Omnitrophota bacterium]